jgi:hypothetical protein
MWEIRRLRALIEANEAKSYLHYLRIVNAGFNGGEGSDKLAKQLSEMSFVPPLPLEKPKKRSTNWIMNMIEKLGNKSGAV